jgi:hypothetical protein
MTLHRWDIVGDDDLSQQLLIQPDLTRHAVDVLDSMPVLYEAPEWRAKLAGVAGGLRIVLRSPNTADIVYQHSPTGSSFEILENGPAGGDAVVVTDVANRYLTIWGRRSAERPLTVDTDAVSAAVVEAVLWGAGAPWAPGRTTSSNRVTRPASAPTHCQSLRGKPRLGLPLNDVHTGKPEKQNRSHVTESGSDDEATLH